MPSVTQCESTQANLATLSALEIFDIFKSKSDSVKDTDVSSEESFHLQLDEDDAESRSNVSSGKDKEETEDDILNKFETAASCGPDQLDSKTEDRILNDDEHKNGVLEASKTAIKVVENAADDKYEKTGHDEFKSAYELENSESENMEVNTKRNVENETETLKDAEIDQKTDRDSKGNNQVLATGTTESATDKKKMIESGAKGDEVENMEIQEVASKGSRHVDIENDALLQELTTICDSDNNQPQEETVQNLAEKPMDIADQTSNQKPQENEYDLLDISVIRDCEEDDAAALEDNANADSDKESHSSEKSDEEQGERTETETSEGEKDDGEPVEETNEIVDQEGGALVSDSECQENADMGSPKLSELILEDGEEEMKEHESNSASDETKVLEDGDNCDEVSERQESEETILKPDSIVADSQDQQEILREGMECEPVNAAQQIEEIDKEKSKSSAQKRSLSLTDLEKANLTPKKIKLIDSEEADVQINDKVKTLSAFAKFMQCRRFASKLSRSDLEQFCIQKICECVLMKSNEGELHQTIKKQEKCIDNLKRDMQQLLKQSKDLEIVNKKLMNELRNQNNLKKPLVPLKITRSVGLQVRLNPGNDVANQRKRPTLSPHKQSTAVQAVSPVANRARTTPNAAPVVKQVLATTPSKPPLTTTPTTTTAATTNPLLSKALQINRRPVVAKRTATPNVRPKVVEASKPANPGVIDLTDEDDKGGNKTVLVNKVVGQKLTGNQVKTVVAQKTVSVPGAKSSANNPPRTVATLPQGVRLTPGSVIASNAGGGSQMLYVLPTINSSGNGTQKLTFLNLQPTNGVLSTVNGSLSANKQNNTITLKTLGLRKHPAPLPVSPKVVTDQKLKPILPKPYLTIKKIDTGIILQWKMPYNLDLYENIASYQLYAYQETNAPPSTDMWRKVGDVKALALPMACTLTQFADKNKYYFAVRSVDVHKRIGAFSDPEEISL